MPLNPTVTITDLVLDRDAFGLADWRAVVLRTAGEIGARNLSMMAAAIAFFAMLALFPGLAATVSLYGYFADPSDVGETLALLRPLLPEGTYTLVDARVTHLVTEARGELGVASLIGVALASWSARAGVNALVASLTAICRERDTRNFIWGMAVSYGLTLMLILVTVVALAMLVVIPAGLTLAGVSMQPVVTALRWGVAFLAIAAGIAAVYRFGPSRRTPLPWVTAGSILSTILWVAMSAAFARYVGSFANYNEVYGPLGAGVATLMWFYLTAFVVLLGALLNAEIERYAIEIIARRRPDLLLRNDPLVREMTGLGR